MYLSVNISNGNNEHVGTIHANDSKAMKNKLNKALEEHFDAEVKVPDLDIDDYRLGKSGTVQVIVDTTDDTLEEEVFITETWLY